MATAIVAFEGWGASGVGWGDQGWGVGHTDVTATGAVGPFQYAVLWDTTQAAPIGFWNYGSAVTLNGTNGDTFTVTLDGTNGVIQVA